MIVVHIKIPACVYLFARHNELRSSHLALRMFTEVITSGETKAKSQCDRKQENTFWAVGATLKLFVYNNKKTAHNNLWSAYEYIVFLRI